MPGSRSRETLWGLRGALRPDLVLVLVTLLWASTFVVTRDVVRDTPPVAYLSARYGLAAAVLLVFFRRRLRVSRTLVRDGALLGLLQVIGLLFQVLGQVYTTATKSAFVTALNTPLTPLVAWACYRARPSKTQLVAVAMASVGLALLTYPERGARWNLGDVLTMGCALAYAFLIVETAKRAPQNDAGALAAVQVAIAALLFFLILGVEHALFACIPHTSLPAMVSLDTRPFVLSPRLAMEVIYMALLCTAVTFAAQTWAMAQMTATHAAVIFALEPVFATLLALVFVGASEWPGLRGAAGGLVVLFAVLVSERRPTLERGI